MADLPLPLEGLLGSQLASALDAEGKILGALAALAPLVGAQVGLLGGGELRHAQLAGLGAAVTTVDWDGAARLPAPDDSFDAVVTWWSGFRGVRHAELAEADRVLRRGGRLLIVHDYGRDDVAALVGERPEADSWSRRNGPFLAAGFRIRVLHCWWTFDDLAAARSFLEAAFGIAGAAAATAMNRPRLSYKVAVYHRTRGGVPDSAAGDGLVRA